VDWSFAEQIFGKAASSADDLKRFEHDFAAAVKKNPATAYESFLADRGWLFRDGSFPLRSRADIRKHWAQTPNSSISSWEVLYSDVATSGDLGYTYGKYAAGAERGYFVHVWKRDQRGKWKLLADILSKLPPEQAN
jgi:ketosteroid isomerase-like protein